MLEKDELKNISTYLLNFCTHQYRRGDRSFLRKMFLIYQHMLEQELLFDSPLEASIYFKNIVTLGITLGEFDWTKSFIDTYLDRLDPKYGQSVYHYSIAYLHFSQGKYRDSLQSLRKVDFIDPFYRLNHDMLLIKTYYECKETESLLSLCNSFSVYIRRNKSLSENNRTAYMNMARFVRKLVRVREGRLAKLDQVVEEINSCELLVERSWFQEKLNDLKQLSHHVMSLSLTASSFDHGTFSILYRPGFSQGIADD